MIMLDRIIRYILEKMINVNSKDLNDIYRYDMRGQVEKWTGIYNSKPYWLSKNVKTMGIGSYIVSELARLTTIEFESSVVGNDGAESIDEIYQKVIPRLRANLEVALAKGSMILKPIFVDEKLFVDIVHAENFIPLRFNLDGVLESVVFIEVIIHKENKFTRLEFHDLKNNVYTITNKAFVSGKNTSELGKEISLKVVEEWSNIEPEHIIDNISRPLYSYFKCPFANNINDNFNLGVSIYSGVESLLKEVDEVYSSMLLEYKWKKPRIIANKDMLINVELEGDLDELFVKLDGDSGDLLEIFSPEIRHESFEKGLDILLRKIEFAVGLAYGSLSRVDSVEKTAEEIRSSKERSYSTVVDIQKALEGSLRGLVEVIVILLNEYENVDTSNYEMTFRFDDSIVVEKKKELSIMLDEVQMNLLKPEYYLMERYGITLEEAIERLPIKQEDKVDKQAN